MVSEKLRILGAGTTHIASHFFGLFVVMLTHRFFKGLQASDPEIQHLEVQTVTVNKEIKMDLINKKLGTIGDIHASIINGKIVVGVDGELDLIAQLEALKAAHASGVLGTIIGAVEGGIKSLTAAPAVAPQA